MTAKTYCKQIISAILFIYLFVTDALKVAKDGHNILLSSLNIPYAPWERNVHYVSDNKM